MVGQGIADVWFLDDTWKQQQQQMIVSLFLLLKEEGKPTVGDVGSILGGRWW